MFKQLIINESVNNNNNNSEDASTKEIATRDNHLALFSAVFNIDDHPEINEILQKQQQENNQNSSSTTTIITSSHLESLKQERSIKKQRLQEQDDDMAIEEEPLLPYDVEEMIFDELQTI